MNKICRDCRLPVIQPAIGHKFRTTLLAGLKRQKVANDNNNVQEETNDLDKLWIDEGGEG